MPGRSVKPEEVVAGRIVADQLSGVWESRDVPGAPDASHDVDITLPDGQRIALEVTSAADEELLSMYAAIGSVWKAESLSADWWISFRGDAPAEIKRMVKGLEAHLRVLEAEGVTEVGGYAATAGMSSTAADAAREVSRWQGHARC